MSFLSQYHFVHIFLQVVARVDGRFYTHDLTLWVQWYFLGTWHYPFVRRRPDEFDLETHPYRLAWYSVSIQDLEIEERVSCRMTMLRKNLLEEFRGMTRDLSDKILKAKTLAPEEPEKYRDMEHSRRGMLAAIAVLDCAPQSEHATLMTVASFQRHFLESLACYEYFTIWHLRVLDGTTDIHPVDTSVMGLITPDVMTAQYFYQLGVPVWLVRPPDALPSDMKVVEQVSPERSMVPPAQFVAEIHPHTRAIMDSPPSAARNRACQGLHLGGINLGHSANERQPGDASQFEFVGMSSRI